MTYNRHWSEGAAGYTSYINKYREDNSMKEPETHLQTVMKERAERYGRFADNAAMAQVMKESFRSQPVWDSLSMDKREALDNISQKVARILTGRNANYKDSWTDIAGYATLVADTLKE